RPHGTPTLTDRETKTLLHRDRLDQLHRQLNVIPRHHHLHTIRQRHHTRHISRTEVELRPIPREERRMPPPLLLLQDVNRTTETRMRRDRTRLRQHLTPLDIITPHTTQQHPDVVTSHPLIQRLTMHLNTRHHRLSRITKTNDLNLITGLHNTPLHTPSRHRATTRDREHILNRHQERLIDIPLRRRDVRINRIQQLPDAIDPLILTPLQLRVRRQRLQRLQRRTLHHRHIIPRELVRGEQLTHLHLHKLQQLLIIHHVHLVQEHDDMRHPHLPRQQDVLTRLRHRTI